VGSGFMGLMKSLPITVVDKFVHQNMMKILKEEEIAMP